MRAYLLGDLDREEASRLELGYFMDPARLRHMKETEDRLIRDYLEGRLSRSVKDRFELRYLSVPELRRRIEAIRAQTGFEREMSPLIGRRSRQTPWRLNPVLLGLILIVLAGGMYYSLSVRPSPIGHSAAAASSTVAELNVRLSPGVSKGAAGGMTEIGTPEPGTAVIFTLDLPRRVRPFKCSAVLLRLDTEGRANPVWSGSVAERRSGAAGGALTVRPDSSVLIPADYLMELKSPTGNVIENYLFGVRVR